MAQRELLHADKTSSRRPLMPTTEAPHGPQAVRRAPDLSPSMPSTAGPLTRRQLMPTASHLLQLQRTHGNRYVQRLIAQTRGPEPARAHPTNPTGLPASLKAGIEQLSGRSMEDVRVRYNSAEPAQLQALAYTRGTDIHVGPGQEQHLSHEAWHVVQQAQGRVPSLMQMQGGVQVNDNKELEREAEVMGAKALQRQRLDLPAGVTVESAREDPQAGKARVVSKVQEKGVVQRYREVRGDEFSLEYSKGDTYTLKRSDEEEQAPFTIQSVHPPLVDVGDPIAPYPVYRFTPLNTGVRPDLHVSDDGTVAIQPQSEPKEFYATQGVLDNANVALSEKKSDFRLKPKGHRILTNEQSLQMISPVMYKPQVQEGAQGFADFITSVCRDITAKVVHGSTASFEAIFQAAKGPGVANEKNPQHRREIDTANATESTRLKNLAGALPGTESGWALDKAFSASAPAQGDTTSGEAYGKALRVGALQAQARELGLNEFAAPEVGEGYAIYGISAGVNNQGQALDFSTGGGNAPVALPRTWGYHFAGVVAASEDGRDKVTLENYNRAADIEDKLQEVYNGLLLNHKQAVEEAIAPYKDTGVPFRSLFRLAYQAVHVALNKSAQDIEKKKEEAADAYKRLMDQRNDAKAWFFQLYGSGKGQSFHERQAASGTIANPLTVRVGRPPDDLKDFRSQYTSVLNAIPAPLPGIIPEGAYPNARQAFLQQIEGRTVANEIRLVFNEALRHLVKVQIDFYIQEAVSMAKELNIHANSFDVHTIDSLRQQIQGARRNLGWSEFKQKDIYQQKIDRMQTFSQKVLALTTYRDQHLVVIV